MNYLNKYVHKNFIKQERNFSDVYFYMDKYMSSEIYNVECLETVAEIDGSHIIWVMWAQGLENAPELVKRCYSSICKNKPKNFEVVLLTMQNIFDYISIPDYILEKYNKGIITTTHLSDIIRLELLSIYGGCWIDATVFCSNQIPEYMLSDMFFFKLESILCDPVIKMSSWWMVSDKKNRIIHATRHMLQAYWKNEEQLRDYFLLHIIMSKVIDEDIQCQYIFQKIPFFNSKNAQILVGKLGLLYHEKDWKIIKDSSFIQKLTYKNRYIKGDIYNFYMALLDGKLE